jgi:hypothetical protein
MKFKSTQNKRTIIAVFIVLLIILETTMLLATTPPPEERFLQFYVLGSNGLAADYYPQNNPNLHVNSPISWYVAVTNFMGNVQLVEIRVKLANETISPPDNATPSSASELIAFDQFILNNGTWQFPFVWSITNATTAAGSVHILEIQVNNETFQISNWSANNGYNFRLILELWVWQTNTNMLTFGWNSNGEYRTAWLELWFNMTTPTPPPPQA